MNVSNSGVVFITKTNYDLIYLETVEEFSVSLSLPMIMWSSKLSCLKEESSTFGTFHFLTIVKNQQHDDNNDIIESVEGKTVTDDHDTLGEHSDGVDHTTDDDDDVSFTNTNKQLTREQTLVLYQSQTRRDIAGR